ncbi:MAG: thioredoxin-disulfide reductase [Thermoleophilia bacterium]|nr:thioredoxin-disulfide reductase [Thermoleophilia bacterium]
MTRDQQTNDVIIIGGGPAGLTAALYCGRARLNTLLLEKAAAGGQAATTDIIENYPGFPEGVGGYELTEKMKQQAVQFGARLQEISTVTTIEADGDIRVVKTEDESSYRARAVIIASGVEARTLGVPGESEFRGKGVSYCATCDGAFYRDKDVAVIGGGNAAVEEAIFLTKFASKVYVIHRRAELRADKILQERAFENSRIEIVWDSHLKKILGNSKVEEIVIENKNTHERTELSVDGVFFYIGSVPNTTFCTGVIDLDDRDFILTDAKLMTSMKGVFACGDCRANLLKQVAVAVGEGALAAVEADRYVEDNF